MMDRDDDDRDDEGSRSSSRSGSGSNGGSSFGLPSVWRNPTVALIALAITISFASQGFIALSFGVHTRNVLGLSRWVGGWVGGC